MTRVTLYLMIASLLMGIVIGLLIPYVYDHGLAGATPQITMGQPTIQSNQCMCALWCHHSEYCNGDIKCDTVWNNSCNTHCKQEQPIPTTSNEIGGYSPYTVEFHILTPDEGYTCKEYYDWLMGVNQYEDQNNVSFDPHLPAIFPTSDVQGATIVAAPMNQISPTVNQTTGTFGLALTNLAIATEYNITVSGEGIKEHSFKLIPQDELYNICMERSKP